MKPILFVLFLNPLLSSLFGQCETLQFLEIGAEVALCRLYNFQTGNGIVYAAATGGTPGYTYQWTNLQTGATANNTTWGGLNPGTYIIQVTDQMGCVLVDTIEVDSINPTADFSVDMNLLSYSGPPVNVVQVSVVVHNTSTGIPQYPGPFPDDTIYWKLGNTAPYMPVADLNGYQMVQFYGPSVQEICLAVENKNGCVDTTCRLIEINESSGLDEIIGKIEMNVFPNPASSFQTIELNAHVKINVDIVLLDITGNLVKQIHSGQLNLGANKFESDLSSLPPGVYFYQISTQEGKLTSWKIEKL